MPNEKSTGTRGLSTTSAVGGDIKTAETAPVTELSDDEFTILMAAGQGNSMMPIGRWEAPVESLVTRGLLERRDKFNNFITSAGRAALEGHTKAVDDSAARAIIAHHNAGVTFRKQITELAESLVVAARDAAKATGDEPLVALQKCVAAIRDRAIELIS